MGNRFPAKKIVNKFLENSLCDNDTARDFCERFILQSGSRYIFGCNDWAKSIANAIEVDGFIDDFSSQHLYCGKPIIRSAKTPINAKVVSAIVGVHPVRVKKHLTKLKIENLDYFAFKKYSGLPLKKIGFIEDYHLEFDENREWYKWLYSSLADDLSKDTLARLVNFRLSSDLSFMENFTDAQDRQYFEPFLNLNPVGERFVDVGCFDGYTTEEFLKRCPKYASVDIFEPEPNNMQRVKARLLARDRINFHNFGAASKSALLRFAASGSASRVAENGDIEVRVEPIDKVLDEPPKFIKMDIEGAELDALKGAKQTIQNYQPRLAISVYHNADDLRRIPELVLSYREDYDLYLRHYTEGVTETVMYFIPRRP